jgi:hypothetical protein
METDTTPTPAARRRGRRVAALVAAFGALALVVAACSNGGGTKTSAASGSSSTPVTITSPTAGAHVGDSVPVKMDLGFPIGTPDTGRQHIHLHVDGSSQYTIAYKATQTLHLSPGPHTIVAVVANADHSETSEHSKSVAVDVSAGTTGGGASTTATTSGTGY